ncbi:unnamed protein product [Lampetra planeri]
MERLVLVVPPAVLLFLTPLPANGPPLEGTRESLYTVILDYSSTLLLPKIVGSTGEEEEHEEEVAEKRRRGGRPGEFRSVKKKERPRADRCDGAIARSLARAAVVARIVITCAQPRLNANPTSAATRRA